MFFGLVVCKTRLPCGMLHVEKLCILLDNSPTIAFKRYVFQYTNIIKSHCMQGDRIVLFRRRLMLRRSHIQFGPCLMVIMCSVERCTPSLDKSSRLPLPSYWSKKRPGERVLCVTATIYGLAVVNGWAFCERIFVRTSLIFIPRWMHWARRNYLRSAYV